MGEAIKLSEEKKGIVMKRAPENMIRVFQTSINKPFNIGGKFVF